MPPWRADIQRDDPGSHVPFSHETSVVTSMANAGSAMAAGLVPGALPDQRGESSLRANMITDLALVWSVPKSSVGRRSSEMPSHGSVA